MVYNTTYSPTDMPGITTDLIANFFVQLIPWIGGIIAVVLLILVIKAIKSR